jgi:hypothetical protein
MHGFQDALQAVQRADRRQDLGGIGPLRAPCLDPPARVAGGQEGVEAPWAGLMGEPAVANIMPPRAVEPWIRQVEAERICPGHAAADGSGGLAIGEPFNVWHHHHKGHAPRGDFHGTPGGRIHIGQELIVIEGAELGAQSHVGVPFGECRLHRGHGRLWDRR